MSVLSKFSLAGKVAVVTGGYGHLGKSISRGLAEAGAKVVVAGKDKSKFDQAFSQEDKNISFVEIDISSAKSVKKCLEQVKADLGRIDVLVNNAYFGTRSGLTEVTDKEWLDGMDGTINGVFRCTQVVIPLMSPDGGSIINISSMYGVVSPDPSIYGTSRVNNPPSYGAGKAAIIQFTKYAACHLPDKNIRVNSISPGSFPQKEVQDNHEFMSNLTKKIPLGRIGRPDELQGAVVFLASDASSYVTGHNLIVDGGWTAW